MGKFIVKQTNTGYKFDLFATNGQVIASSQVYASEASCLAGIESVIKNAQIANIEDQTVEPVLTAVNPKFELYLDKGGEYRFRLKARNGEIIVTSEGYKSKASATNGIASVQKNVVDAKTEKAE
jgi:uncharacterized protein YegP (UPF0339 family)